MTDNSHHTTPSDDFNWNDAYTGELSDFVEPDDELLQIIKSLPVSSALDLGCGAGGLVVALAERGWKVTGVDVAEKAIRSVRKKIKDMSLEANLEIGDSGSWKSTKQFDLVISSFALPRRSRRADTLATLAESVAAGGSVLLKEFDSQMNGVMASDLPTIDELTTAFSGFEFLRAEIVKTPSHDHGSGGTHSESWTAILIHAVRPEN